MISDPVRGLARRHGSVMMDERLALSGNVSPAQINYARNYREYSFFLNGVEYSIIYMAAERSQTDTLPFCYVLNKDTGKFLNVVIPNPAALKPWTHGGVSAITTVGAYVVMASHSQVPAYSQVESYAAGDGKAVAWVRGGAYSRTFSMTVKKKSTGQVYTVSTTTMASAYPNLLDTSGIPATINGQPNPDYQKQVNDVVYAYNSAVTKWVGDAAKSIQPQNIAAALATALTSAGFTATTIGGSILLSDCATLSVDDSGDGTLFRGVLEEIDDPAKVSGIHWPGKVIRVAPKGASEPYYLKAIPDNPNNTGPQTVTWTEGAWQTITPTSVFALGAVSDDGQSFYIGHNAATLNAQGFTVPDYIPSSCGDVNATLAFPYFFGKRITLLTCFMDRLVIVANGVIFLSRSGDYFNFFRKSMLTVADDDPIEVYALGAEDDIISKCVSYNKDLFMFGQRKQYSISGRTVLTPKTASVSTTASESDSMYAQPVVSGNLIFYGKYEPMANVDGPSPYVGQISQFQLGAFQDTPETYRVSQQLTKYIRGRPTEIAALASPNTVFIRTDGYDNGIYVYNFLDSPGSQQRQFDAWSRWEWSANVGRVIGMCHYQSTLLVFLLRGDGTDTYVACDQFVMDSNLSSYPYLDARRALSACDAGCLLSASPEVFPDAALAIDSIHDEFLIGNDFSRVAEFTGQYPGIPSHDISAGFQFNAAVTPTPPYVHDQNDKAVVNGRLVVNRYTVSLTDTGAMDAFLTHGDTEKQVLRFNGRRVGDSHNRVGLQPIVTTSVGVPVGRCNTEHTYRLQARDWLPLTISAIEWVGQYFNNTRRV